MIASIIFSSSLFCLILLNRGLNTVGNCNLKVTAMVWLAMTFTKLKDAALVTTELSTVSVSTS